MAASEWGQGGKRMKVKPALAESCSALFNLASVPNLMLPFRGNERLTKGLSRPRLERAIGVLYLREIERRSHYFESEMPIVEGLHAAVKDLAR